ncbi:MAG: AmmeMemoRadiSam system radical SAM enzyme [Candidatus Bathyarchaeia archaeon]
MKISDPFVREAYLYDRLSDDRVRCNTCNRRCVLSPGQLGFCKAMKNIDGTLYSLEYGLCSSLSVNPIEKKPLFHFWPGSRLLTFGSWSCNFTCPWCQNHDITKTSPEEGEDESRVFTPAEFVELALCRGCQGTSMSFSEPTTFLDFGVDVFKLARERGLVNTVITNGYFTPEALELYIESGADAFNIDLKGDADAVRRYCSAEEEPIWANAVEAKSSGAWVELTTLVIPGVNDEEDVFRGIAERIYRDMGSDTPWHISRYFPCYEFHEPRTPMETLRRAHAIGEEEGLNYVYLGNVPSSEYSNTYCPECGKLLIERRGYTLGRVGLDEGGACPNCGCSIPLVGEVVT